MLPLGPTPCTTRSSIATEPVHVRVQGRLSCSRSVMPSMLCISSWYDGPDHSSHGALVASLKLQRVQSECRFLYFDHLTKMPWELRASVGVTLAEIVHLFRLLRMHRQHVRMAITLEFPDQSSSLLLSHNLTL